MISDSMPERRNLVVASMGFIAFYASGGRVVDSTLSLPLIRLQFQNPDVLASMAWIMLFWFALRFWQATHNKFAGDFQTEIKDGPVPLPARRMAQRAAAAKGSNHPSLVGGFESVNLYGMLKEGSLWIVHCGFIQMQDGHPVQRHTEKVPVSGWILWASFAWAFIRYTLVGNSVANYVFPFGMFFAAVFSPCWGQLLW